MRELETILQERETIASALRVARTRSDEDSVVLLEYLLLRWDGVLALIRQCERMHA